MTINIPSNATEIFNRMAVDLTNELGTLDPFLRNSFIKAITVADANSFFELYQTINQLIKQTFWDTATEEFLERWASIYGVIRLPATKSSGFVTFTGISTTIIPISSEMTESGGSSYTTLASGTITTTALSVTSILRVSQTATATTAIDHGLASDIEVVISGAAQTEYNGTFVIVVTGLRTFTYTVSGTPAPTATGTILSTATYANIKVESSDFGSSNNLESGGRVSLSSPIAGVDTDAFISFDEIGGGADKETDSALRDRFLFRVQNPIALFNNIAIEDKAKEVPGVTRVFVQNVDFLARTVSPTTLTSAANFATFTTSAAHGLFDGQVITVDGANDSEYNVTDQKILVIDSTKFGYTVTGSPASPTSGSIVASFGVSSPGQVRVFFVRDNDLDIIPTASEVTDVENKILTIKPATISASDVIVEAPVAVTVNFTFTAINPNTQSMKDAIKESLTSFFSTGTTVSVDLQELEYNSVIINTVDATGFRLETFTLATPVGDVAIEPTELAILGTITFS